MLNDVLYDAFSVVHYIAYLLMKRNLNNLSHSWCNSAVWK